MRPARSALRKVSNLQVPSWLAGRRGRGRRNRGASSAAFSAAWGGGFGRSGLDGGDTALAGVIRHIKAGTLELEGRGGQRALQNTVTFGAFLFQRIIKMLNNLKAVTAVCTAICI
jgi:hypothetical protein